jgi:hypothetical protein
MAALPRRGPRAGADVNVLTTTLNPFTRYLWVGVAGAVVAVLAFSHLYIYRAGRHAMQEKWDAATVKQERAAQEQAATNRELQRLAEQRLHVLATTKTQFLKKTAKEIRDASAPLAACPVPADSVRLLNDARECAIGDSAAACGAGDGVPPAR